MEKRRRMAGGIRRVLGTKEAAFHAVQHPGCDGRDEIVDRTGQAVRFNATAPMMA